MSRIALLLALLAPFLAGTAAEESAREVAVGSLVYAGGKTSTCFSDGFLALVRERAGIATAKAYRSIRADKAEQLAGVGFAVMSGEGAFTLADGERTALKAWMHRGGFLLASAGCSSSEWTASFRAEAERMFGKGSLVGIQADHPVFSTLFAITDVSLAKRAGSARFEGVIHDGRLVCLFSPEGLNDTGQVKGCCCCGGNEVKNAREVVANALVYALVE